MLEPLIQLRWSQNSHHLSLYPSGKVLLRKAQPRPVTGTRLKGATFPSSLNYFLVLYTALPGDSSMSPTGSLGTTWFPVALKVSGKKEKEMVIRDKWEQLCENWSVIWGRKSSPYLSQNFSTLFKVLINVLFPSKPNVFKISYKSFFSPTLEVCYFCLSTPWMSELWLSDWVKSLGPTKPPHNWGDGRNFVINEKLKFCEIYIA